MTFNINQNITYHIHINVLAINAYRKKNNYKLDAKDGMIVSFFNQFMSSKIAQKYAIKRENDMYYYITYQLIIDQNPLLDIDNKQVIAKRLKNLQDCNIIKIFIDKDNGNKTYISTTEVFESFFLKVDTYQLESQDPIDSKVDTLLTQKLNNNNTTYNNTQNNTIYNNKKYKKENPILSEKEILFENFYKLYNNKEDITEQTKTTKGYNKLKEKFLKETKTAKEEDILQGTRDYLSFIAFEHKRGFNRPLKDIQTFINQSGWEGDKGIPWNEIMQKNLNQTKETFINKINAPNAYELKKQMKEQEKWRIDDDLPF